MKGWKSRELKSIFFLLPRFPLLRFPALHSGAAIFTPAFSTPAISALPHSFYTCEACVSFKIVFIQRVHSDGHNLRMPFEDGDDDTVKLA